ncbi:MAG TPA: YidB family protein [Gaiellaceae bacterium]|nr:YidB family protein [Gaiellaceae bacterium]
MADGDVAQGPAHLVGHGSAQAAAGRAWGARRSIRAFEHWSTLVVDSLGFGTCHGGTGPNIPSASGRSGMSLFDDLKAAISTGDTTKLQGQLKDLIGDLDLDSLKQKFEASGLGDKVQSWISTGPNTPATAEDIKKTMDPQKLQALADKQGVDVDTAAQRAADVLPDVVDKLTPEGKIPVSV